MPNKGSKKHRQRFEVIKGEGKRFSFTAIRQAFIFYLFLLIALAIIVQLGYHWLGEQFLAWQLQVITAEPGIMQEEVAVEGVITRDEETFEAPSSGLITYMATSGERVPPGKALITIGVISRSDLEALVGSDEIEAIEEDPDEVLRDRFLNYWQQLFLPENEGNDERDSENEEQGREVFAEFLTELEFAEEVTVYSDQPGFLSFSIDGWENYHSSISPENIGDFVDTREGTALLEGELVRSGQPVVKIVDNWQWYYSLVLPLHPGRSLTELPSVDIEFSFNHGELVGAALDHFEIDDTKHEVFLTYMIEKQITGFDRIRWTEAILHYNRLEGVIVPAEAIIERENNPGVYLNHGGRVVFQPVTIIKRQDEKVLVEGLIPSSRVISRPELVQEGQRLN